MNTSNRVLGRLQTSICTNCHRKSIPRPDKFIFRPFPSSSSGFATSAHKSAITSLPHRQLVSVSGHDAPKFLQGLTTNNVDPSRPSGWYSAFLNAQGRVLWEGFIYPTKTKENSDWSCVIEVDRNEAKRLISHLKRHKLRSKVAIRALDTEELAVWAAWGTAQDLDVDAGTHDFSDKHTIYLEDPRLKGLSHRFLLPSGKQDLPVLKEPFSQLERVSPDEYLRRRYMHGIAEGSLEIIPEHSLPHESNLDHLNAIDFRKGCYVGQELTIRTQHTGVVRKRILPVDLYNTDNVMPDPAAVAETIPHGASIKATGSKRPAGKWLTGKNSIGLAVCRLSQMTDMIVGPEESQYIEGREFGVLNEDALQIKLKASVPDWLRVKERAKRGRHTESMTAV